MEINRVGIEMLTATVLTGCFCQLLRVFYQTSQIGQWAYFCFLALVNLSIIAAIYYLKRGRDVGELTFIIAGVLIGLWISI